VIVCPACGEENSDRAKFCQACASPIEGEPTAAEERRIISVLFVDLVGFTTRAERLDPEDVRAILSRYHERARSEIDRFGGTVEKFVGDAVMAVFGAPVAHGDDPERAVRAALSVRDALQEMNVSDPTLDLKARFAVNTGEAMVALGARPNLGEAMVAGDVVNTAARLQTAAPVDGVIVGEQTYAATRTVIDYEPIAAVEAKGKAEPVKAWLAVAPLVPVGQRSFLAVPLIGRGRELATLRDLWDRVVETREPTLATVFGQTGIGKSRLAYELAQRVNATGDLAVRGRSVGYEQSGPYSSFAQQVKQIAGIFDSDQIADSMSKLKSSVAELVHEQNADEVTSHLAVLLGLASGDSTADRESLFFSARLLVEALAERQPTLLIFEDIHWADPSLLDLIEYVAGRTRDVPLLMLALARPELVGERPSWGAGLPDYTALQLEALSHDDAVELTDRLLQLYGLSDLTSRAEELAATGEGNPLFLEELSASLAEHATGSDEELPTSIQGIISARLDALPPAEREVLRDASVAGKTFWRGSLEELRPERGDLPALLSSLERRGMIRREAVSRFAGEQQYTFKHVLIREVAYRTLLRAERKEAHGSIAKFLEAATPNREEVASALGYHWREAGDDELAIKYFLMAADQASRGWAKERATALYRDALTLIPESHADLRREVSRKRVLMAAASVHIRDAEVLRARREDPGDGSAG
jgi:class 3 adenylate cyclase